MSPCDRDLLLRFADCSVDAAAERYIRRHLEECPACRDELAEFAELEAALRRWAGSLRPLPQALEDRVATSVRRRRRLGPILAVGRMMPAALGTTVAAVLVMMSANLGMLTPATRGQPVRDSSQLQTVVRRQSIPLSNARRVSAMLGLRATQAPPAIHRGNPAPE